MVGRVQKQLGAGIAGLIVEKDLVWSGRGVRDDGLGAAGGDSDHVTCDRVVRTNRTCGRDDRNSVAYRLPRSRGGNATAHIDLPGLADENRRRGVGKRDGRARSIRLLGNGNDETKAAEKRSIGPIPTARTGRIGRCVTGGARYRNPDADGRVNRRLKVGPGGLESDVAVSGEAGGGDAGRSRLTSSDHASCADGSDGGVGGAPGDRRAGESQAD